MLVSVLFGLLNIFAGICLWRDKQSGYILSIIAQAIQLLSIQTPSFHYVAYTLVVIIISLSKLGIATFFGAGAAYKIVFVPQPVTTTFVGVNMVALILLILIGVIYRRRIARK